MTPDLEPRALHLKATLNRLERNLLQDRNTYYIPKVIMTV